MPTYIHQHNLIVPKETITTKYKGGMVQFRKRYDYPKFEEDNELFGISRMNYPEEDIRDMIDNGLHFDSKSKTSKDFVIVSRYGGIVWEVDWLETNAVFVWHKDCDSEQISLAQEIEAKPMDEIEAAFDRGELPWDTIK